MTRTEIVDEIRLLIASVLLGWVVSWLPDRHPAHLSLAAACRALAE